MTMPMDITDHTSNYLQGYGAAVQTAAALVSLALVVLAYRSANRFNEAQKRFNEGQAMAIHIQNVNHFNDRIIDLAISDKETARRIGRPVTKDSDILSDYMYFILLNSIHVLFAMQSRGVTLKVELSRVSYNVSNLLRTRGEEYVNAILARGYEKAFVEHMKQSILDAGGYQASVPVQSPAKP